MIRYLPKIPELKETILDIKATNKNNETFIVEMQRKDLGDFTKRSLYYTSKAYVQQLPKGNEYSQLKKVYFIGILNFNIFDSSNHVSRHLIINQETNKQDLKDFEFTFIELPKFKKELKSLETLLYKWIYFLKNAQDLTMVPEQYKEFKSAFNIATQTTWNTKELEVYDYMSLKEFDEINALKTAERKGMEKGMEKGEQNKAIEIAKRCIAQGLDNQTISSITNLDIDIIKNLGNK